MSGDSTPPSPADVDELFRRIGRNLLNYQGLEHGLKAILAASGWSGPAKQIESVIGKHQRRVEASTLGQLAGRFGEHLIVAPDDSEALVPDAITEPHVGFRVTLEVRPEDRAWIVAQLEAVTLARNDLVHHFGRRWNRASAASTQELLLELDRRREEVLPIFEHVRSIAHSMGESLRLHAEVIKSDAFWEEFERAFAARSSE